MSVKNGSFSHFSVSYPAASSRLRVKVRLSQSTSRSRTALCLWKMMWETIWPLGPGGYCQWRASTTTSYVSWDLFRPNRLVHFNFLSWCIAEGQNKLLPSLKLTKPLKANLPKRKVVSRSPIFRGYASFREVSPISKRRLSVTRSHLSTNKRQVLNWNRHHSPPTSNCHH